MYVDVESLVELRALFEQRSIDRRVLEVHPAMGLCIRLLAHFARSDSNHALHKTMKYQHNYSGLLISYSLMDDILTQNQLSRADSCA